MGWRHARAASRVLPELQPHGLEERGEGPHGQAERHDAGTRDAKDLCGCCVCMNVCVWREGERGGGLGTAFIAVLRTCMISFHHARIPPSRPPWCMWKNKTRHTTYLLPRCLAVDVGVVHVVGEEGGHGDELRGAAGGHGHEDHEEHEHATCGVGCVAVVVRLVWRWELCGEVREGIVSP